MEPPSGLRWHETNRIVHYIQTIGTESLKYDRCVRRRSLAGLLMRLRETTVLQLNYYKVRGMPDVQLR